MLNPESACSGFKIHRSAFSLHTNDLTMTKTPVTDAMLPTGAGASGDVVPHPAASVILLRGEPFEVLMMRRTEASTVGLT